MIGLLISFLTFVYADNLGSMDQEAMGKTIDLLNNPQQRNEAINKSPGAQKADGLVKELVGLGASEEQIYKIASQIFESLVLENKGDAESMKKKMESAQKNPEGFYNSLSSDQKAKIAEIIKTIRVPAQKQNP